MIKSLSKSQYCRGLQCLKALWLYRNKKKLMPKPTPSEQLIFDQGHEVGLLAWKRFPGGVEIADDHEHPDEAIGSTNKALNDGAKILYEPAFLYDDVLIRVDILIKNDDGTWDLIEVKSSTEVKNVYLHDVAIQRYVLNGNGMKIRRAYLMHVNKEYVREGEINPMAFFHLEDVTDKTCSDSIAEKVNELRNLADGKDAPTVSIGKCCGDPYPCAFKDHCWKEVPEYSIWNLTGARMDKKEKLWRSGVKTITDISKNEKLTERQRIQIEAESETVINRKAIKEFLASLKYPLCFMDFENLAPAIPLYDGMRPYQALPFQASIHVQQTPMDKELIHLEYLGDGKSDPRRGLMEFLCSAIVGDGSVMAYNSSHEAMCLRILSGVANNDKEREEIQAITDRLIDMAIPFRKSYYSHKGFLGRWSLKAVLPVMAPGMGYEDMDVGSGTDAQVAYVNMMAGLKAEESKQLRESLLAYCAQDTEGMVHILNALHAIFQGK